MKIINPQSPGGHTIFCDDIRKEDNGKLIFIGVYLGEMIFPDPPPFYLPTFTAFVTYRESIGEGKEPVMIKLILPGIDEPAATVNVPVEDMRKAPAPDIGDDTSPVVSLMLPIKRYSVVIPQEGMIRVRAYRGNEEIRLGALRVIVGKHGGVLP
jgi:hypothetical protein